MDVNNNHHDEETEVTYIQFSEGCKENVEFIKQICTGIFSRPLSEEQFNIIENSILEYAMTSWSETEKMERGIISLLNFFEIVEKNLKAAMYGTIWPNRGIKPCERLTVNTATLARMLDCDRDLAEKIGNEAEAKLYVGDEVLWNHRKVEVYVNEYSG